MLHLVEKMNSFSTFVIITKYYYNLLRKCTVSVYLLSLHPEIYDKCYILLRKCIVSVHLLYLHSEIYDKCNILLKMHVLFLHPEIHDKCYALLRIHSFSTFVISSSRNSQILYFVEEIYSFSRFVISSLKNHDKGYILLRKCLVSVHLLYINL